MFNPKSIAVIGASHEKEKVGRIIYDNLSSNSKLKVYPVNVKGGEIDGKKVYENVKDINEEVELAIVVVPATVVPVVLDEVGLAEIKYCIIISAGFGEAGNIKLEKEIEDISEHYGIKILGPNCMGVINPYLEMNASFFERLPGKGNIAFLSQSGAIGSAILDTGMKLSGFVSLGNMLNTDFSDWIEYFSRDKNTEVIMMYIEDVKNGEKFFEACKRCSKKLVVLKSGKSKKGQESAKSHTAALASDYNIYQGIFEQLGVVEVDNIYELIRTSRVLSLYSFIGQKACIVGNAGGLNVLASDYSEKYQIELPRLPKEVKQRLNEILPKEWSKHNPIDIIGDARADRYMKTLEILDQKEFFDFFIVILTPQQMTQPMETAEVISKLKKPVFAVYCGGKGLGESVDYLRNNDIIVFSELENLFKILGRIRL